MDKKYSNCPLKKRPIFVIKELEEEETELKSENIDDITPVDLSASKTFKKENSPRRRYEEIFPINYSRSKSPKIKRIENIKSDEYILPDEPKLEKDFYMNIQSSKTSSFHHFLPKLCFSPIPSPPESDLNSPLESKEYSDFPIASANGSVNYDYYEHYHDQSRNYNNNNNNNIIKYYSEEDHDEIHGFQTDQEILSPSPSHFSYGSGRSEFGDYSEPEDLSMKSVRKVLTDSNANVQRDTSEFSNKSHAEDLYYQCRICNKCYSTYAGLIKHQQCHSISPELQPNQSYSNINSSYVIPSANIIVPTTKVQNTNKELQASMTTTNKSLGAPRYQCKDCGKSYSTYSGLTKHQQFHCPYVEGNQAKKIFSCKNCDKVYVSLGALKMHIRTHTLPCKCPLCGKAFSRPWLLQGHIRTHTGEKPFTCQHCQRAFADRSNLRAHLQTHSEVKKYCCISCTKTFSRMSLLTKHMQGGCNSNNNCTTERNNSNLNSSTKLQMKQYLSNEDIYYNRNEEYHHHHHHHQEQSNYESHTYVEQLQNYK